jgi:hypothetical protein
MREPSVLQNGSNVPHTSMASNILDDDTGLEESTGLHSCRGMRGGV